MSRSRLVVQLFRLSPLPRDATRLNLKPFNRVGNSESEPGKFSTNPFAVLVQKQEVGVKRKSSADARGGEQGRDSLPHANARSCISIILQIRSVIAARRK